MVDKKQAQLKTLRLMMPQWQGGYDGSTFPGQIYPFGARLLAWLAPESDSPLVEVPVEPDAGGEPAKDAGVFWRKQLLRQLRAARSIIDAHAPDRIITFGGDCLVSQAPFAYLNERYNRNIGIIWIDAHPDVTTPKDFDHAHAMVLGNLLGEGEPSMAKEVKMHYNPEQVLLVGLDGVLPHEQETINRFGLKAIASKDISQSSEAVTRWIRGNQFDNIAVHLDLDVLDPKFFRSLLFSNPAVEQHIAAEVGKASLQGITRLLTDISGQAAVAGISFAEHMPWDALNLKNMLSELPFMR